MDDEEIEHLRTVYNKEHSDEPAISTGTSQQIWNQILKRLQHKCKEKTALCVVNEMMNHPIAPKTWNKNRKEWLSSLDIDKVEKQYQKLFPKYAYLGTIPIDFDKKSYVGTCIVNALCSISLKSLIEKEKTQVGIVFNTDVSTGPGQHWIALFVDIRSELDYPQITYFDSYAQKPEKEIQRLMFRWKEEWDSLKIHSKPMKLQYNTTRHQFEDSECGMYSLLFHMYSLVGEDMDTHITDKVVRSFRGVLFRILNK